ncbi:hypothetical protein LXL04_008499 [Taraxacum kok-saghyz]
MSGPTTSNPFYPELNKRLKLVCERKSAAFSSLSTSLHPHLLPISSACPSCLRQLSLAPTTPVHCFFSPQSAALFSDAASALCFSPRQQGQKDESYTAEPIEMMSLNADYTSYSDEI